MIRRDFLTLLGGAAVAWPPAARAQQATRSYRIAYLVLIGDLDAVIIKQRLAELGYAEGKNLIFDFRSAEGQPERLLGRRTGQNQSGRNHSRFRNCYS
jgi:putative ABC transport system substrate-binding protein